MDSFGNYPRERPFDPFSVMLFKALQVVAFLFFIALLVMNPEAKQGKIDTKAEFIITMSWPDSHPDDIDLYVEDPLGNIVWYHEREAGFMVLDRDDRGGAQQHHHRERQEDHRARSARRRSAFAASSPANTPSTSTIISPRPARRCRSRSRSRRSTRRSRSSTTTRSFSITPARRRTAVRFRVADDGSVTDVNHRDKSLIQLTRSVRRTAK